MRTLLIIFLGFALCISNVQSMRLIHGINNLFSFSDSSSLERNLHGELMCIVSETEEEREERQRIKFLKKICCQFKYLLDLCLLTKQGTRSEKYQFIKGLRRLFMEGESSIKILFKNLFKHLKSLLDVDINLQSSSEENLFPKQIFLEFMNKNKCYRDEHFSKLEKVIVFFDSLCSIAKKEKFARVGKFVKCLKIKLFRFLEKIYSSCFFLERRHVSLIKKGLS